MKKFTKENAQWYIDKINKELKKTGSKKILSIGYKAIKETGESREDDRIHLCYDGSIKNIVIFLWGYYEALKK